MRTKLIGIGGTNGAGKDSIGQMLADRHGWLFISVSDILRAELVQRGIPIERKHLRELSAEWRTEHNLGVLIDKSWEAYQLEKARHKGLVIAALRHPGEADRIHELGGQVLWVDADPEIRYLRAVNRQRSREDQKTFEDFLIEEQQEMEHSEHKATLSLLGVKKKADIFIQNDGVNVEVFQDEVEKILKLRSEK